jgi:hypothetical protein
MCPCFAVALSWIVGTVRPQGRTAVSVVAVVLAVVALDGGAASDARVACPSSDRKPVTSHNPAGGKTLVPPGARGVLLCRYRGLNPRPERAGRLARSRRITDKAVVSRLVREFDALRPPPTGARACPSDDASMVIAFFAYRRAADVAVAIHLTGCADATNGRLQRTALYPGSTLIRHLKTLTR